MIKIFIENIHSISTIVCFFFNIILLLFSFRKIQFEFYFEFSKKNKKRQQIESNFKTLYTNIKKRIIKNSVHLREIAYEIFL